MVVLSSTIRSIVQPGLTNLLSKSGDMRTICRNVINNITVTGKVLHSYGDMNEAVTFNIKSMCSDNYTKTHKVFVSKENALFSIMKENLKPNQKVRIEGKLSTSWFLTADDKHRSASLIWPRDVRILSDVEATKQSLDENSVELSGVITTDFLIGKNFKCFTLATSMDQESNNLCYNRVFVYDKSLFPLLESLQITKDPLLVHGKIIYRKDKNEFGRNTSSSSITATQIHRM